MKRVFLCAPLYQSSGIEKYTEYLLRCGAAPVAPHFFVPCLDRRNPDDVKLAWRAETSLLWMCDEMWVFGDELTSDMKKLIAFAENLPIPIQYISLEEVRI